MSYKHRELTEKKREPNKLYLFYHLADMRHKNQV